MTRVPTPLRLRRRASHVSLKTLVMSISLTVAAASAAHAQFVTFAQLGTPVGVATDADGNVFVSHDNVNATLVSKFGPNGTLLGSVQIGGFFDITALGTLASIPSSGVLLQLLSDGRLIAIDPENLALAFVMDVRSLAVDVSAVHDILSGTTSSFGGVIQPNLATYGDLAIRESGNRIDLFITGLSQAQAFPFVMRIGVQDNAIVEARVLMSSAAETVTDSLQAQRLVRGIAVNNRGTVLTTLPYAVVSPEGIASTERPYDVAVAFPAAFDPSDGIAPGEGPRIVLGETVDLYSQGMTADAAGNFYIATNAVGTAALGTAGEGVLVILPVTLDRVLAVLALNRRLTSFRDVALSPNAERAYVSVELFSVGPAVDVVVAAPVTSIISSHATRTELSVQSLLSSPYPNPFADHATVEFETPTTHRVRVDLYDLLGRPLKVLYDGTATAGVVHKVPIDGSDLPPGVYVVRLVGGDFSASRRVVLVR